MKGGDIALPKTRAPRFELPVAYNEIIHHRDASLAARV